MLTGGLAASPSDVRKVSDLPETNSTFGAAPRFEAVKEIARRDGRGRGHFMACGSCSSNEDSAAAKCWKRIENRLEPSNPGRVQSSSMRFVAAD